MAAATHLGALLDGLSTQGPPPDVAVTGISLDSRQVRSGDLFLALAGRRGHGLQWAAQAMAAGCAAIAWQPAEGIHGPPPGVPAVAVDGLQAAAGTIAARFYGEPSRRLKVVGVTGTNGKSSCVEFLAQALQGAGETCGTLGTLGSGLLGQREQASTLTTPDAVTVQRELARMAAAGARYVVAEVSSHALDQDRVAGVHFEAAVFTNLTRDHLDYHPDFEHYAASKARLFAFPGLRIAIINADDAQSGRMREAAAPTATVTSYGMESGDIRASDLKFGPGGTRYTLVADAARVPVASRLLGRFNVANQLAVAACLLALGWRAEAVAEQLAANQPPPGRMQTLGGDEQVLVVIDYAHTPDALEAALEALRGHCQGRLVCVFGCGGDRDRGKRPMMGRVAERLADVVVVTDDNPRTEDADLIVADILSGARQPGRMKVVRDRGEAIREAIGAAGDHDAILIAGKGHEDYQEIGTRRRPFSDLQVATAALEAAA